MIEYKSQKFNERISTYFCTKVSIMTITINSNKGWQVVENKGKLGVADKNGNLLCPAKYSYIRYFSHGMAPVCLKKSKFGKEQWGIINEKFEETLFSESYEDVEVCNSKFLAVKVKVNKKESKWGIIKKSGEILCPPKYDECPEKIGDGLFVVKIDGKCALIDENGRQICKAKYTHILTSNAEVGIFVGYRGGNYYRMNKNGIELNMYTRKSFL